MELSPNESLDDDLAPSARSHGGLVRLEVRWLRAAAPATLGVSWYQVAPGDRCTVHVHEGKAETWFFIAGQAEVVRGDERLRVSAGDAVHTPSGIPHGFTVIGTQPVRFVNIVEPVDGVPITTTEIGEP